MLGLSLMLLLFAILNPNWLFQPNERVYGLGSIIKYFGRTTARWVVGILGGIGLLGCMFIGYLMLSH
ncbi:Imm17 family immunity protein [Chitinophaga skermanii]